MATGWLWLPLAASLFGRWPIVIASRLFFRNCADTFFSILPAPVRNMASMPAALAGGRTES